MEFSEFKHEELVGKTVLYEFGQSYSNSLSQAIRTITKITKTGFRISKEDNILFSFNGDRKGLGGRMNMGSISRCKLISESEANRYRKTWADNRDIRLCKEIIKERMDSLTHDHLKQIVSIITNQ